MYNKCLTFYLTVFHNIVDFVQIFVYLTFCSFLKTPTCAYSLQKHNLDQSSLRNYCITFMKIVLGNHIFIAMMLQRLNHIFNVM